MLTDDVGDGPVGVAAAVAAVAGGVVTLGVMVGAPAAGGVVPLVVTLLRSVAKVCGAVAGTT